MASPINLPPSTPSTPTDLPVETPSTPIFGPDLSQDTISSAHSAKTHDPPADPPISLAEPNITISQYSSAVLLSINNSNQTTVAGAVSDLMTNKTIDASAIDVGQSLLAISNAYRDYIDELNNLASTTNSIIDVENGNITNYNNEVSSSQPSLGSDAAQIGLMNTAIANYNAQNISDADFNTAATQYNTYVNGRNTALQSDLTVYNESVGVFQNQVDQNNATIQSLNEIAKSLDPTIPPIPLETELPTFAQPFPVQPLAPLNIPVPSIPTPQTLPTLSHVSIPPAPTDFLNTFLQPVIQSFLRGAAINQNMRDVVHTISDFFLFALPRGDLTQPPSYFKNPPAFFQNAGSTTQASGGVGLTTVSPVFGTPGSSGVISRGIAASDNATFQARFSDPLLGKFALVGHQIALGAALESVLPAIHLVGPQALSSGKSVTAFNVAFGIAYAQSIIKQINAGKTYELVNGLVGQELNNTDQATQDQATQLLTNQLNLFLLQNSLFISSASGGTPGLVGQVFGNVSGIPPGALQPTAGTPQEVLQDNLKQVFLKSQLSSLLVSNQQFLDQSEAEQLINEVYNAVLAKINADDVNQFNKQLLIELQNRGVEQVNAIQVAALNASLVEKELNSKTILNSDLLSRQKIHDELTKQLNATASLDDTQANAIANTAVQKAFNESYFSNATELQILLQNQLVQAGVSQDIANKSAGNAVARLNALPSGTPPLLSPILQNVLPPADLNSALHGYVQGTLENIVGTAQARTVADSALQTYLGHTHSSVQGLLEETLAKLEKTGADVGDNHVVNSFRSFMQPNIDLFAFSRGIMDPANNLFQSISTGVMYSGMNVPTNWKKDLDIKV